MSGSGSEESRWQVQTGVPKPTCSPRSCTLEALGLEGAGRTSGRYQEDPSYRDGEGPRVRGKKGGTTDQGVRPLRGGAPGFFIPSPPVQAEPMRAVRTDEGTKRAPFRFRSGR